MSFQTMWSVDLGKSALKAVRVRRDRNNIEILAIDKVDYPLSAVGAPGAGRDATAQCREALSVFHARNEVKDPLVVAHPGQGTFSRFIKIPAFEAKKVKDMVRYEASQQIPFPLDEVIWDYHLIEREYMTGEEREVGLFAVRRETIEDFLVDFQGENLTVEMLTLAYLGSLNFILHDVRPEAPAVVLDIGASHTDLIFVDGQRFWIRPIPHSGNDVTRAIMSRFRLDFPEAEKLKIEAAKVPKQAAKIFQAVIQPKLQELVAEVHRSIGYYRSQAGEVKFSKVILLGNASKVVGIKKYLEDHLRIPVERVASISRLRVNRDVNVKLLQAELPAFATALGCGVQALGMGAARIDLLPKEEKVKKEIARKKKHVFFAAGIILLAIFVAYGILQGKIERAEQGLKQAKDEKPKLYQKEVEKLKGASLAPLLASMDTLKGIAEVRQGALSALRCVEKVVAKVPTANHVDEVVRKDDKDATEKALQKARDALKTKLWIPQLSVTFTTFPEAGTTVVAKKAAKDRGAEKVPTVPAYKVSAYVVVQARETPTASNEAVKELFHDPLVQELKIGQFTKLPDATTLPGKDGMDVLYYEPGKGGLSEALLQDGKPFFGAPVEWFMVTRLPEKPAEKAAASEESTEEAPKPRPRPRPKT